MNLGWGGGQALVQKWRQVSDGGIDKIFAGWGDSPPPQEEKPWHDCVIHCEITYMRVWLSPLGKGNSP